MERRTHANATPTAASSILEILDKCCESAVSTVHLLCDDGRQSVLERKSTVLGVPGVPKVAHPRGGVYHCTAEFAIYCAICTQATAHGGNLQPGLQTHLHSQQMRY